VVIGDATGWMRPFKGKGINTAVETGVLAAEVIMNSGVSRKDFQSYANRCSDLLRDKFYGKAVRFIVRLLGRLRMLDAVIDLSKKDTAMYEILYDSVSGRLPYRKILLKRGHFKTYLKIAGRFLKHLFVK
jgi:flavin-dependent dehydrogenase